LQAPVQRHRLFFHAYILPFLIPFFRQYYR